MQIIQDFGDTPNQCVLRKTCKEYSEELYITYLCRGFNPNLVYRARNVRPICVVLIQAKMHLDEFFSVSQWRNLKQLFLDDVPEGFDIKSVLMQTDLTDLCLEVMDPKQLDDECILHNKNLKSLNIRSNCNVTDTSISKLDLQKLELYECKGVTDKSILANSNLQRLVLSHCSHITSRSLSGLKLRWLILNSIGQNPGEMTSNIQIDDEYKASDHYRDNLADDSLRKIRSQKNTLECLDIRMAPDVFNFNPTDFPLLKEITCFKLSSIDEKIICNCFKFNTLPRGDVSLYKRGTITIGSRKIEIIFQTL
jgi:hypothetical protein